jgi:ABC-2 type transport system permease protein
VHALWYAPLYGWLLLVSGWARRTPLLWALLPPLALSAFERIVFQSAHFGAFLKYRLIGGMAAAFALEGHDNSHFIRLAQLDPLGFLTTPGLWLGLCVTAGCIAAATRLRRNRDPI